MIPIKPILWSLLFLLFTGGANTSFASHILGGNLAWDCISSGADAGKYRFRLSVYWDCSSTTVLDVNAQVLHAENHPDLGTIPLTLSGTNDVSPTQCGSDCASGQTGTFQEYLFESDPVTIDGVPPPEGFIFSYYSCCRGAVDNIIDAFNDQLYFRGVMYPYEGKDLNPCYDSSPDFAVKANNLLCSGYEFRYASTAQDSDLDSLSYAWSPTLGYDGSQAVPVNFQPNYSYSNPLPNPSINASYDQATLDPVSGLISYDTDGSLVGRWSMTMVVYAWRNGMLISENTRELLLETTQCAEVNQAPQTNGAANTNIVVNAGDLVTFDIGATDLDQPQGNPQNVSLVAIGNQFGANFNNPNSGCVNPPCATLTNITPPASGLQGVNTTFTWQTECNHIASDPDFAVFSSTYNFIFRFEDDQCPVPGVTDAVVSVTVLADPILPSPEPHCVSVLPNNDIQVDWEPIVPTLPVPLSFAYVIYHSTSATGNFVEVGSVTNIATGSFTHSTGTASDPISTGPNYYKVRTRSGCVSSPVTDQEKYIIASIYLTVTDAGATADLSWTPVVDPPLPSSNGNGQGLYQVFKEYPAGTWTMIGATTDLTYSDPVTVCTEQVNYRIELTDDLPCTSISNIDGQVLTTPGPDTQPLDSVSVNSSGLAELGWPPNTMLGVTSYSIDQQDISQLPLIIYDAIDQVMGYNNTSYVNPTSTAISEIECYRIQAANECGDIGVQEPIDQRQCTMLLGVELEPCARTNHLTWTHYRNWPEGVKQYEIWMSKDGGPELKIAQNADPNDTTYSHVNLQLQANYCYRVRAVRNVSDRRITSSSNTECELIFVSKIPDYNYAYGTTVESNDQIVHHFFVDSTSGITRFEILRGQTPETSGYVGEVEFDVTTRFFHYSDFRAKPDIRAYYFANVALNECDQPMDTSNFVRTIFLEAVANPDRTNVLEWNEYEGWPDAVNSYNIYRNFTGDYTYLATVPATTLTYTDNVIDLLDGEGNFCYYVEAQQDGPYYLGDPVYSFNEKVASNTSCAPQYPNVFVPNAFAPNGLNKVFLPISVYVDLESYVFTIYDRFGGQIFQTQDKFEGWTGSLNNGMEAAQGVYAYTIEYETASGVSEVKTGTITLYR